MMIGKSGSSSKLYAMTHTVCLVEDGSYLLRALVYLLSKNVRTSCFKRLSAALLFVNFFY